MKAIHREGLKTIVRMFGRVATHQIYEEKLENGEDYEPEDEPQFVRSQPFDTHEDAGSKSTAIATGCIPCSLGHIGTCSGLLNESMRFARNEGVGSEEVIDRVNMCLDELNALERVDLRPEMMHGLPAWEKDLAQKALDLSRRTRHSLEGLRTIDDLETVAATVQTNRQEIGKAWFRTKLDRMSPDERQRVAEQVRQKVADRETDQEDA